MILPHPYSNRSHTRFPSTARFPPLPRQYPVDVAGPGISVQPEPRIVGDAIGLFVGVEPHQRREGTEKLLLAQAMAVGIDFRHGRAEIETAVEALWPLAADQDAGAAVGDRKRVV